MYCADLTPYAYHADIADPRLVNFGWLARGEPFATGPADLDWRGVIARSVINFVNACRGTHTCDLCGLDDLYLALDGERCLLGHAECWIPAKDGRIFVAPTLVYHYIVSHAYRPPDVVIQALRELPTDVAAWDTPDGFYQTAVARVRMP